VGEPPIFFPAAGLRPHHLLSMWHHPRRPALATPILVDARDALLHRLGATQPPLSYHHGGRPHRLLPAARMARR